MRTWIGRCTAMSGVIYSGMRARARLVASVICLAAFAGAARETAAQTSTGDIEGTVHDALGGAVPGAAVTITQVANGLTRERTSDHAGRFLFSELPVGDYIVSVEPTGFSTVKHPGSHLRFWP